MSDPHPGSHPGAPATPLGALRSWLHHLPIRQPWMVILAFLLLASAGGTIYFTDLEIVSSRRALTDASLDFNRRWRDYRTAFDHETNQIVLIVTTPEVVAAGGTRGEVIPPRPDAAQRDAMKKVADRWTREIAVRPDLFPTVRARVDPDDLGDFALLYAPFPSFERALDRIDDLLPSLERVAADPGSATLLGEIRGQVSDLQPPEDPDDTGAGTASLAEALQRLEAFFGWFRSELEREREIVDGTSPEPARGGERAASDLGIGTLLGGLGSGAMDSDGYLFVADGRLLTAVAATEEVTSQRNRYGPALEHALAALEAARAEIPDTVELEVGLAGSPAVEYEEMLTSQRDFLRSSLLAFLLVSALFMVTFGSVVRPGLAAICLGMGIGMTFLVPWLLIGHLNVLAMVFVVILVALGIDFAIHFYTHYRRHLGEGDRPDTTILKTYSEIGGALWLAGLATALAFLSAYFTEFPGLSELGLIAGGGLLLSLLCMYFAFPAMLNLVDGRWPPPPLPERSPMRAVGRWTRPRDSAGARALVVAVVTLSFLGIAFGQYDLDTNLLEVEPSNDGAAGWQSLLLESEDRTTFALAVYPDRASLERARTAFEESPVVSGTQAAFPDREPAKRALLVSRCEEVRSFETGVPGPPRLSDTRRELFGLRQTLRRYQRTSEAAGDALAALDEDVGASYLLLGQLPDAAARTALARIDRSIEEHTRSLLNATTGLFCPPQLDEAAVPEPLRAGFIAEDGRLALRIYPARDTWRSENLAWFIAGARAIEPTIFGGVVNVHENAASMVRSFLQAAGYSAAAVLALLLVWSRSLRTSMIVMMPVVAGVGLLLGTMRWGPADLQWNVANLFAIPILIGVGIDGGIHLVRAWRLDRGGTFRGAMEAVLVSSITTMTGFGILATGDHSGVASLGLIVFLGVGFNLLLCVTVLPLALAWLEPASPATPIGRDAPLPGSPSGESSPVRPMDPGGPPR